MGREADVRQERIAFLICRLLETEEYLKIEDLADELFVSRMTLDRLIPIVRQRLEDFSLRLVSRPKHGIKVEGNEQSRRRLLLLYGTQEELTEPKGLREEVRAAIVRNGLRIGDVNLRNLTTHLSLMLYRLRQGKAILKVPEYEVGKHLPRETAARDEICAILERHCGLSIPQADRTYLLIHLMVKCAADDAADIRPDMLELADEILEDIYQHMHVDFRTNEELRTALALHLHPLVYRMMYNLLQQNPILTMVRREMNIAFDMAQHASLVIYNRYGLLISEDETAYIALHFAVALERLQKRSGQRRIVLLQSGTRGARALLQWNLQEACGYQQEDFICCASWELGQVHWEGVDCIVSSIPLEEDYPVPVVLVAPEKERDAITEIKRIHHQNERTATRGEMRIDEDLVFTDLSFESKEQALTFLCGKIQEKYGVELISQALKREMLASTEVGNGLAVPHPYAYEGNHPILAAMTLQKELFWKYDHVRMILFVALPLGGVHFDYIGTLVGELATDSKLMKRLIRSFDAKTINELLTVYRTKLATSSR